MPKKTKKEKIIAEYRRKIHLVSTVSTQQQTTTVSSVQRDHKRLSGSSTDNHPLHMINPKYPVTNTTDISIIRHDLARTLTWASIAIAIEFILYYQLGS